MKKSLILLDYIHKKGIVHRNIKSNTLVNTEGGFGFMGFILKDFYYSCFYDDDDDATNCSLNNININVFFKKLYDKDKYTFDIWKTYYIFCLIFYFVTITTAKDKENILILRM